MVTNTSKTELIYFGRKPIIDPPSFSVDDVTIRPSKMLKVLRLTFQEDLKKEAQVARTTKVMQIPHSETKVPWKVSLSRTPQNSCNSSVL